MPDVVHGERVVVPVRALDIVHPSLEDVLFLLVQPLGHALREKVEHGDRDNLIAEDKRGVASEADPIPAPLHARPKIHERLGKDHRAPASRRRRSGIGGLGMISRRTTGRTTREATSPQAEPIVSRRPRPKMPRWAASIRLPNPTIVVRPFSKTPITVLRATSGPPRESPSRYRKTMLRPNSAEIPIIRGSPQILARLNLSPSRCMTPMVHNRPSTRGKSASRVSRRRRIMSRLSPLTRVKA